MARITVEDCLSQESNRFSLVRLASKRAKELLSGKPPATDIKGNRPIVAALREIADGKVRFKTASERSDESNSNEDIAQGEALGEDPFSGKDDSEGQH